MINAQHSQHKKIDLTPSGQVPFCEGAYPILFHNNPTPQSLSNKSSRKLIDVNAAWENLTGYKKKDVVGRTLDELNLLAFHPVDAFGNFFNENDLSKYREIEIHTKTDGIAYGLATFRLLEFGGTMYVISTVLDSNALKTSKEQLFIAHNFSNRLLESMYEAIMILDEDFTCIGINSAFCELTGYGEKDIVGTQAPFPHWPPEDYDKIQAYLKQCRDDTFQRTTMRVKKANGERFEMAISATQITNQHHEVIGYVSTGVDISKQLKYQNELFEKSKKSVETRDAIAKLLNLIGTDFDQILKKVSAISAKVMDVKRVSIWKFNEDGSAIVLANAHSVNLDNAKKVNTLEIKNYPNYFSTLSKNGLISVDNTLESDLTRAYVEHYLKPLGITSTLDVFVKGVDKVFGIVCFEHIGIPRKWTVEEEEFATMVGSIISMAVENAERTNMESKLLLEKEFSDELLGSLMEGLSVLNLNGEIIRVNDAFCKMTGFTKGELIGTKPPFKFWAPEFYKTTEKAFQKSFKQSKSTTDLVFMRKNGERFPVSLANASVSDTKGNIAAHVATIIDITNRINEEKALKNTMQMAHRRKEVISKCVSMVGQDFESAIKCIIKMASEALEASRVSIWKFKNDETELVNKIFYDAMTDVYGKEVMVVSKTDFPEYFKEFDSKFILNIDDVQNHSITKAFTNLFGKTTPSTSRLDVVIHGKNAMYGIISFESIAVKKVFNDQEENFVSSIVNIISLMVESRERMALENQLIKTNDKLLGVNIELNTLKKQLEQENSYLREEIGLAFNYEEMVYGSRSFSDVLTDVERVAATNATVLLLGESGTGKELLARAIHNISERKHKPLIKVNCAAIPRELIESELFGHKKGSFTGAINDKLGKFQLADGGTLFLDEIGELPLEMQPKLLRAIQESEIEQVGGVKTQKVDIRIIVATNRDLEKEIKEKNFREDLFFRINVFPINIPPLRERIEDIPILIEHFVNKYAKLYNKKIKYISEETKRNLQSYRWPGNVRELENLVERAVILSNDEKLVIPNFKSSSKETLISDTVLSLNDVQRNYIKKILIQCHWKIDGDDGAAKLLKIKPSTLRDRMKKFHIERPD